MLNLGFMPKNPLMRGRKGEATGEGLLPVEMGKLVESTIFNQPPAVFGCTT